jgi:glycosyltransferase involved in cell wall biosynthesis
MRIVFLTGIWPPDVGGPASHGPDFAGFLRDRGHEVLAITMADGEPSEQPVRVQSIDRSQPFVVRYPRIGLAGAQAARHADIVYATGTYAAAAAASLAARRPFVVKLVSDPAYERARRFGVYTGTLEAFARERSLPVLALKHLRTAVLRRARRIVVPSRYLAEIAGGWGLDATRIDVLVNPAPPAVDVEPQQLAPGTFVFAGRLTEQKALPVALAALRNVPGALLAVVGDGPERPELVRLAARLGLDGRVTFVGARPREEVLRYLAGSRAALLSSAWENLPHAAVEALAVGVPVVATSVGGVPEVVRDNENGLLVEPNDPGALASAMRAVLEDDELRARLAAAARPSVAAIGREPTYARLEAILVEAAS